MHDEVETEDLEGVDPADLPFSAGIPPGSSEALVGKICIYPGCNSTDLEI